MLRIGQTLPQQREVVAHSSAQQLTAHFECLPFGARSIARLRDQSSTRTVMVTVRCEMPSIARFSFSVNLRSNHWCRAKYNCVNDDAFWYLRGGVPDRTCSICFNSKRFRLVAVPVAVSDLFARFCACWRVNHPVFVPPVTSQARGTSGGRWNLAQDLLHDHHDTG